MIKHQSMSFSSKSILISEKYGNFDLLGIFLWRSQVFRLQTRFQLTPRKYCNPYGVSVDDSPCSARNEKAVVNFRGAFFIN